MRLTREPDVSHRLKREGLHILERRTGPEDLEGQVQALKKLQKRPGVIVRTPVSKSKRRGFLSVLTEKRVYITRLFSRNSRRLGSVSKARDNDSK